MSLLAVVEGGPFVGRPVLWDGLKTRPTKVTMHWAPNGEKGIFRDECHATGRVREVLARVPRWRFGFVSHAKVLVRFPRWRFGFVSNAKGKSDGH